MRKTNSNKAKLSVIALTLVACLMVAGVSAYFTDGDTATNEFTVGKISLDLQEPSFTDEPVEDLVPNQEIKKDPQIVNNGINDEFVFLTVSVPYANITVAAEDGTKAAAKENTELFTYTVNDGWVEVGYLNDAGELVELPAEPVYRTDKTVVHLYAYATDAGMKTLEAEANTGALFNAVKFVNAVEDEGLEDTEKEIVVNAYGIQADHISNGDTVIDGENAEGETDPVNVWSVVAKQAPVTTDKGDDDISTDMTTPAP